MIVWPFVDVGAHLEGGIFLRELGQRHAHLFLVGLGLRLHGDFDHRRREVDRLEHDRRLFGADRVARDEVLEANGRADIAGENLRDLFALVGVHLQQTADALRLASARVQNRVAGLQRTRVDADEDELADKRVGHDLEAQRSKRLRCRRPGGPASLPARPARCPRSAEHPAGSAGSRPPRPAASGCPCS